MITNTELQRQSERILALIQKAENAFDPADEMRSHLAKYICVLCSGFLENAIRLVYADYVRLQTPSLPLISFSEYFLGKIQNPNSQRFKELAKSFRTDWEESLRDFIEKEERSAAINYIIRDRHKIAHGKDSEITLSRIKEYHLKTVEVVQYIENQCISP